jgi:hypothetical protein
MCHPSSIRMDGIYPPPPVVKGGQWPGSHPFPKAAVAAIPSIAHVLDLEAPSPASAFAARSPQWRGDEVRPPATLA